MGDPCPVGLPEIDRGSLVALCFCPWRLWCIPGLDLIGKAHLSEKTC